jgi:hypothetical protein
MKDKQKKKIIFHSLIVLDSIFSLMLSSLLDIKYCYNMTDINLY